MREILRENFIKAEKKYYDYLVKQIENQVKILENHVEDALCIGEQDRFQDFYVRLVTDNSYSDYHNIISFLTVVDGSVVVGKGVFNSGDYDYSSFYSGDLPDEISELEVVLNEIESEVTYFTF